MNGKSWYFTGNDRTTTKMNPFWLTTLMIVFISGAQCSNLHFLSYLASKRAPEPPLGPPCQTEYVLAHHDLRGFDPETGAEMEVHYNSTHMQDLFVRRCKNERAKCQFVSDDYYSICKTVYLLPQLAYVRPLGHPELEFSHQYVKLPTGCQCYLYKKRDNFAFEEISHHLL